MREVVSCGEYQRLVTPVLDSQRPSVISTALPVCCYRYILYSCVGSGIRDHISSLGLYKHSIIFTQYSIYRNICEDRQKPSNQNMQIFIVVIATRMVVRLCAASQFIFVRITRDVNHAPSNMQNIF